MTTDHLEVLAGGVREMFRKMNMGERAGYKALHRGDFSFVRRVGGVWIVPKLGFERYLAGEMPGEKQNTPAGMR